MMNALFRLLNMEKGKAGAKGALSAFLLPVLGARIKYGQRKKNAIDFEYKLCASSQVAF
jgi:hypothetical protein